MDRIKKTQPERFRAIKVIWKSPLIPSDPLVWRKDLSAGDKKIVRDFILGYGVAGAGKSADQVEHEKKVLTGLQWSPFRESSNRQLLPIRQLALFRDKIKLEADANMAADEKAKKIGEIDAKLADLNKQMGS